MTRKLVFICSGNTCRSPMAQEILKKALADANMEHIDHIEVGSAGLWALASDKATPEAITVMRERGVDISSHRAAEVDIKTLEDAEWIVTMTRNHLHHIADTYPHLKDRLYTLYDFAGRSAADVADPFGGPLDYYRECRDEIEALIIEAIKIRFGRGS